MTKSSLVSLAHPLKSCTKKEDTATKIQSLLAPHISEEEKYLRVFKMTLKIRALIKKRVEIKFVKRLSKPKKIQAKKRLSSLPLKLIFMLLQAYKLMNL